MRRVFLPDTASDYPFVFNNSALTSSLMKLSSSASRTHGSLHRDNTFAAPSAKRLDFHDVELTVFTGAVTELLKNGDKLVLPGFGSFSVAARAERIGRNPQTGNLISGRLITSQVALTFFLPVFSCMPNPKYDYYDLLDFIAHFMSTENNAADFPRFKFIELFTNSDWF